MLWNLFEEMDALRRQFDQLFSDLEWTTFPFSRMSFLPALSARMYPLVNVSEDADGFTVEALAPGLDTDSLKITVVRNVLTIEGQKKSLPEDLDSRQIHRNERGAGKFLRTFQLPRDVDADKVTAEYTNGMLLITLPKREEDKPRQIELTVS
jgi:HSP20 family protein